MRVRHAHGPRDSPPAMTLVYAVLLGAAVLGYHFYNSLHAKELATHAARETCRRQDLQLLDGTVVLQEVRLARLQGALGWKIQRRYCFDYTTDGVRRQSGFVLLLGLRVDCTGLAAP